MADWKTFDLSELLSDQVETSIDGVQTVTDVLVTVGNVSTAILEVLKVFNGSFPNPVSAAIQVLLGELQTVIDNLEDAGANGLFLIPTTLEEMETYRGGYSKFRQVVTQSLYDVEDPNRPQIGPDGVLGAFFLLFTTPSVSELIYYALTLENLIDTAKTITDIQYPAPTNITISPADSEGREPDTFLSLFSDEPELTTLRLSWEEPKYQQNLFYDIFARNKFYIEKSKSREGTLLTRESVREGLVNPLKRREDPGNTTIKEPVLNRLGQPVYVWEPLNPDNPFFEVDDEDLSENFIAGTYSYVIRNVEKGIENGYYYRIRSVPKDVELRELPSGPDQDPLYLLELDGQTYTGSQPSVPVFGHLSNIDTSFDFASSLLNVYRAAYQLRFDASTFDDSGNLLIGSNSIEPRIPAYIEQDASFTEVYDVSTSLENTLYFEEALFEEGEIPSYDESQRFVATKGVITASTVLETDPFSGAREMFSEKLGLAPRDIFRIWVDKEAISKIESILPVLVQNDSLSEIVKELYQQAEAQIESFLTEGGSDALLNEDLRTAVHLITQVADRYEAQGVPPNWKEVRIFEDLWPEATVIMDRLFRAVNSLDTAFANVGNAIDNTIEGLERRLLVLDQMVDFLDEIASFFTRLQNVPLASILFIPPESGGVPYLVRSLLQAGDPPPTGPDDFFAGIALTIGGPGPDDALGAANALKFIFGV